MAYCCCLGLRGNLDFPDFLQKKFYNINYCDGSLKYSVTYTVPIILKIKDIHIRYSSSLQQIGLARFKTYQPGHNLMNALGSCCTRYSIHCRHQRRT